MVSNQKEESIHIQRGKQQVKIIYYMSSVYVQVACTWDDIKSLRQDMDKSTAEGKVHFRGKLLQAISVMQVCTVESHKFEVLRTTVFISNYQ